MSKNKSPEKRGNEVILSPSHANVKVEGKLHYSEGAQSWNLIRLRKEVIHEFPELKEKSSKFSYRMIIPKTQEGFKEILQSEKEVMPILLFLSKNKQKNINTSTH